MKVVFVNPPFTKYGGLKGHGGKSIPINLCYLAAYAREQHPEHEYKILDAEALEMSYEEIEQWMQKEQPDVVGISLSTASYEHGLHVLKSIKKVKPDALTFAGGLHPTAMPEECAREDCLDVVVISEGEHTCAELVDAFAKGQKDLSEIKGIAYLDDKGEYVRTKPRGFIKDLDSLPFPARELTPLDKYMPPPTKRVSDRNPTSILGERGCPHECNFCITPLFWKRTYRARSPKNIVDEIEECVKKYDISEFNFHDDLFTFIKPRVMEFCRLIKERKLDIAFHVQARVDTVDPEMLKALHEAGCKKISFGFESGSQKILDNVKKRATPDMAKRAVKMVNEAGIHSSGSFMIGNLGETPETIKETIKFARSLDLDTVAFQVTTPFPGTELYRIAKERGYLRSTAKFSEFATVSKKLPIMNMPNLSSEELLKWRKVAYRKFYMRPKYVWRKVKKVASMEDIKNLFEGLKLLARVSS